MGTGEFPG